ncbi:hypothetical protein BH11PSE7_BH11PSE7_37560 [soil metagenome]
MLPLTNQDRSLLHEIFQAETSPDRGVDRRSFRAHHQHEIPQLNKLEDSGYLKTEDGRYVVSLLGLTDLASPEMAALLEAAGLIFAEMKKHYVEDQQNLILLTELSTRCKLPVDLLRKTLPYMCEFAWYGGRSAGFPWSPDAAISANEGIFSYQTFTDGIEQLRETQIQNEIARRQMQGPLFSPTSHVNKLVVEQPDWHLTLEEPLPTLLREIYESKGSSHRTLPAMGARAVIDLVCTHLVGDIPGGFAAKLKEVHRRGFLSEANRRTIDIAFDAGSAVAHRGHIMESTEVDHLLEIMNHLLNDVFRMPGVTKVIEDRTPKRNSPTGRIY